MEENKDLRDEELVEESNTVEGNTEATENEEVEEIIDKYTKGRMLGIFGEEVVNVLEVNLALDGILE